jgi:outer membrane protein TolC
MVVAMEAMARMATFETEMARRERLPPLTLSAGWSFRTKDMWDDMALAGLSISVPLFASRNQNARVGETAALAEAASRDLEAARLDLELERSAMSSELESLRARDAAAVRMADAARVAMEAARSAYAAGAGDVATLVVAHHRHSEALEMDAMLRTEATTTYARLAALLGTSLLEHP